MHGINHTQQQHLFLVKVAICNQKPIALEST